MAESSIPLPLRHVAKRVQQRLRQFLSEEQQKWDTQDAPTVEVVDVLAESVLGGGKRIRAAFCYWSWEAVRSRAELQVQAEPTKPERPSVVDLCAAIELLHTFALVHDDVMDDSDIRRGQPAVHIAQRDRAEDHKWRGNASRFGESVAILVGNLGHVYADTLVEPYDLAVRNAWNAMKLELNVGQYLDVRSAAADETDEETARKVAWHKSALYSVRRPMQLGAKASGCQDASYEEFVRSFSRPLGRAFQLRDDLLGIIGDPAETGKPIGDDLRAGKSTELVAFARAKATPTQQNILDGIGQLELRSEDIVDIVDVIHSTGAVCYVKTAIDELVASAKASLDATAMAAEPKDALHQLGSYLALRKR